MLKEIKKFIYRSFFSLFFSRLLHLTSTRFIHKMKEKFDYIYIIGSIHIVFLSTLFFSHTLYLGSNMLHSSLSTGLQNHYSSSTNFAWGYQ